MTQASSVAARAEQPMPPHHTSNKHRGAQGHPNASPIWSRYFSGLHFPTMALYVFCDQSQKMPPPPPPDPDPPSGAKIISILGPHPRLEWNYRQGNQGKGENLKSMESELVEFRCRRSAHCPGRRVPSTSHRKEGRLRLRRRIMCGHH